MRPPLRRIVPAIALAAVVAPLALTTTPAQAATSVVEGRVVDGDGHPVAGMLVASVAAEDLTEAHSVPEQAERRALTGADGRFSVEAPAEGGYVVRACPATQDEEPRCQAPADDPAWLPAYVGQDSRATSWIALDGLLQAADGSADVGDVVTHHPSRIVGRLVNGNAQPMGGRDAAELVVLRRLDGTQVDWRFLTSENYVFEGLAPGRYRVESFLDKLAPRRFRSDIVEVGSEQTVRVDATLGRPVTVTGRLTASGRPVSRQFVSLVRGSTTVSSATVDAAGRYTLRADRAGTYTVRWSGDNKPYLPARSRAVTVAAGGRATADVRLQKGAAIRLSITNPAGGGTMHQLRTRDGRLVRFDRNEGRTFAYQGLAPGRYVATILSGTRYTKRAVTVRAHRTVDLGRVRLDRRAATWSGTTAPDATMQLVDARDAKLAEPPQLLMQDAIGGLDGRFRTTGIVPGTYVATARPVPGTHAPGVRTVRVTGDLRKDVPLPTGGAATGRFVRDLTGAPLDVPLSVEAQPQGPNRRVQGSVVALSTATGAFTVEGLMSGPVDLTTNVSEGVWRTYWEPGSPYYFAHPQLRFTASGASRTDLGEVRLQVGGGPVEPPL